MEVSFILYNDDCIDIMKTLTKESVDVVIADPPYFLSNGGKSISSGKVVSVNKGEWDKKANYENVEKFTNAWIKECYRILKNKGCIFITGTMHNIFDVKKSLDQTGFRLINIIIWKKTDPPPLIYKNKFRFSYEFILWCDKGNGHTFNYNYLYNISNKEMEDVWILPAVTMNEKKYGYHPTQKPESLLERIILAVSKENDLILDPFMGSGTTCVVAKRLKRKYIGIEKQKSYFDLAVKRINSIN